jgi:hypothetical protein
VNLNTFSAISDRASCLNPHGGAAYFIPILSSGLRTRLNRSRKICIRFLSSFGPAISWRKTSVCCSVRVPVR